MLPAERLGRILDALLGEGRPRTIRGAGCRDAAGRRPSKTVPSGAGRPYGDVGLLGQLGCVVARVSDRCAVRAGQEVPHVHCPSVAVSVVSAGLALALLSLLLYKLRRVLAVLAVLLLPLPLRLFGALHAVAALPLGIGRPGGEPVAVGAGLGRSGTGCSPAAAATTPARWVAGCCGRCRCPASTRQAGMSSACTSPCRGRSYWC
jgi:hypothetical protein